MQYSARIHIKVSSPNIWRRFFCLDHELSSLEELAYTKETSFVSDGDWAFDEQELQDIVIKLAAALGKNGIIIADTTNINTDPSNFCVFYLGSGVRSEEFYLDDLGNEPHEKSEMYYKTDIGDIPGWLGYGRFQITQEEDDTLFSLGIAAFDGQFYEFSTDLTLPEKTYLRETSFHNRAQIIEKLQVSEEMTLVPSPDIFDPLRLEVMSPLGSVGFLPSDVGEKLTPILWKNRLIYSAKVVEVIPLSRRNPHARSSIVAVHIDAELSLEHRTS